MSDRSWWESVWDEAKVFGVAHVLIAAFAVAWALMVWAWA